MKASSINFCRLLALALAVSATASILQASLVTWWARKQCDWDFVQKVGGIEVVAVRLANGRPAVKIRFDPSGSHEITRKPEQMNSALIFDRASAQVHGDEVRVTVYTSVPAKGRTYPDTITVPLPKKTHGRYRLRYKNPDRSYFEMGVLVVP